jgi:hypothetical protein
VGGWCKIWFNSRSLNSFFNWTIFSPLLNYKFFLNLLKNSGGWGGDTTFLMLMIGKNCQWLMYILYFPTMHIYIHVYTILVHCRSI